MFTESYRVLFEQYADRHFIKDFQKNHKTNWDKTRKAIVAQLANIDLLFKAGRIPPPIYQSQDRTKEIYKHSFAIAGRKESPKSSGNRVILFVDHDLKTVRILIVYSKNHVGPPNETAKWQKMAKDQYTDIFSNF